MVVMTMMVVRLCECRTRNHQDHGKKQSLLHVQHHNNKVTARMPARVTFGLLTYPNDVRSGSGEIFQSGHHGVALVLGAKEEDQGNEQVDKIEIR